MNTENLSLLQANAGNDYRITEYFGKFTVEKSYVQRKKMRNGLFRTVVIETTVWKPITRTGRICYSLMLLYTGVSINTWNDKLPDFDTLEDAKKYVQMLLSNCLTQPVYHNVS